MAYSTISGDLDDFFGEVRSKLVRRARAAGLSPADAEDCAQEAIMSLLRLLDREPERRDEPERLRGWLWMKIKSLQIDLHRRVSTRAEQPLESFDADGNINVLEVPSGSANPEEVAEVNEIIERGVSQLFLQLSQPTCAHLVRLLLQIGQQTFPLSQIDQYRFARTLVFSGKGPDKRCPCDLQKLASLMGKTEGATMTELNRLQPRWKQSERDVFRRMYSERDELRRRVA